MAKIPDRQTYYFHSSAQVLVAILQFYRYYSQYERMMVTISHVVATADLLQMIRWCQRMPLPEIWGIRCG